MVEVIPLIDGERPPRGERYLVIEWSPETVSSFVKTPHGLHYRIGRQKHRFWSVEGVLLAERLGLKKVYYIGKPEEVAWPLDVAQVKPKPPAPRRRRSRAKALA